MRGILMGKGVIIAAIVHAPNAAAAAPARAASKPSKLGFFSAPAAEKSNNLPKMRPFDERAKNLHGGENPVKYCLYALPTKAVDNFVENLGALRGMLEKSGFGLDCPKNYHFAQIILFSIG